MSASARKELARKLIWVKSDEMRDSEIVYSPSPEVFKYNLDDCVLIL